MKKTQLWSEEDCKQFVELTKKYFEDFYQIAIEMNRSYSQIRSHFYNLYRKPHVKQEAVRDKQQQKKQKKVLMKNSYIIFDDIQ
ncbi:SANT/Myb_domain [Hexamita inflata]|uniref:SANT/Myb domain n=1 Tax=Hexamita inflata TaxID=28002 RepID=A0AA86NH37_9EUKA|nr:SANT/Myb domain [Hexamita inflata]CAI9919089.1 SANT/Myb domain [Hexamita inflata]CAI9919094.1 SANT/Myb domain [Hexamita inflata]CAI9919116.1 SANT/Myb domain [Hexamita inflata]CAI9922559.1 SANT/Myb domain [Hexamita inflata]